MSKDVKKANSKTANGSAPGGENTCGVILPKTACAPAGTQTQVPTPTQEESYWEREERIAREMDRPKTLAAHLPGIMGLLEIFGGRGRGPKTARQAAMPQAKPSKPANKAAEPGKPAAKEPPPASASGANGANGGGGGYSKKVKRRPEHKCELMAYEDMICDGEKHHVVPHWTTRTGNAKTKFDTTKQVPGTPAYDKAPAICLSKEEHKGIHKTVDDKIQQAAKGGTVNAGQVKTISAEEAAKKSGCNPKNIRKQLNSKFKTDDDALWRGVKDARKMTEEISNAVMKPKGK